MAVEIRINYKGKGPNGDMLYWTVITYPENIMEEAAARAAELGVSDYIAPREDSSPNDWGWAFEPEKMRRKAEQLAAAAKAKSAAKDPANA